MRGLASVAVCSFRYRTDHRVEDIGQLELVLVVDGSLSRDSSTTSTVDTGQQSELAFLLGQYHLRSSRRPYTLRVCCRDSIHRQVLIRYLEHCIDACRRGPWVSTARFQRERVVLSHIEVRACPICRVDRRTGGENE